MVKKLMICGEKECKIPECEACRDLSIGTFEHLRKIREYNERKGAAEK
jgi:hypothetical protein